VTHRRNDDANILLAGLDTPNLMMQLEQWQVNYIVIRPVHPHAWA